MGTLRAKRALITGGGQGLGAAISRRLAEGGCSIAVHYRTSAQGAEQVCAAARACAVRACALQADLTDETAARDLVEHAVAELGGLDILVNNCGDLVRRARLEEIDAAYWTTVMDVNLRSVLHVTQQAVPHLAAAGASSIVNLASLAGRKGGHAGSLAYSTSKGAVITWTRVLSNELAGRGIRVNCVAPGLILGTRFHDTHTTEESARQTVEGIPLGRAGAVDDVARAVVFLASEYDGFITGATLDINGGVYCA
jgi:3-oxoacyl-[acyl-carrier protein] reductase